MELLDGTVELTRLALCEVVVEMGEGIELDSGIDDIVVERAVVDTESVVVDGFLDEDTEAELLVVVGGMMKDEELVDGGKVFMVAPAASVDISSTCGVVVEIGVD